MMRARPLVDSAEPFRANRERAWLYFRAPVYVLLEPPGQFRWIQCIVSLYSGGERNCRDVTSFSAREAGDRSLVNQ